MHKFKQVTLLAICLSCFVINTATSQRKLPAETRFKDTILHKFVYSFTEVVPAPEGGLQNLFKQLSKKLKWPSSNADYAGKIIVAFVIEPDGKIDGERVIKDPSGSKQILSKQIFKIVKTVKWKPGTHNGKAVPVLYPLSVTIDVSE